MKQVLPAPGLGPSFMLLYMTLFHHCMHSNNCAHTNTVNKCIHKEGGGERCLEVETQARLLKDGAAQEKLLLV